MAWPEEVIPHVGTLKSIKPEAITARQSEFRRAAAVVRLALDMVRAGKTPVLPGQLDQQVWVFNGYMPARTLLNGAFHELYETLNGQITLIQSSCDLIEPKKCSITCVMGSPYGKDVTNSVYVIGLGVNLYNPVYKVARQEAEQHMAENPEKAEHIALAALAAWKELLTQRAYGHILSSQSKAKGMDPLLFMGPVND
ncbi:hypothetical protein A2Z33_01795 [Candidatus Gottesmanbacteria bacterium RBG_16_52_11]|uniref:Uncharacterized protein n=1 Tax=Candidatus Gottesmanbacteria bacterium RBG_16_52_11 TaxID=1798374 RepID=A0A1F5YQP1_9BACT|nr:MAG: hypothetical protein A2Z33_01795 [Candidatus Gottesmanbacteria bacterium RBG_16_52_11]